MNIYDEFIDKMKQNNLNKGAVIDVLNIYVNGGIFLQRLKEFISKEGERREYNGVIYSDEYEQDDEGYFGEDKVLFYSGDGDDDYDIVNYDELYKYLSVACEFYIEKNSENKETIGALLVEIKEKYKIK
jgi:hypothetical protein